MHWGFSPSPSLFPSSPSRSWPIWTKRNVSNWGRASLMVPLKPGASGIGREPYHEELWNLLLARVISNQERADILCDRQMFYILSVPLPFSARMDGFLFSISSQYQTLIQRVLRQLTAKVCKRSGRWNRCIRSPWYQELPLSRIIGLKSYWYS